MQLPASDLSKKSAIKFVVLFGIISLFADMTYEGARGITGPFLATLGANAAIVGFVAGLAEFLGYALRYVSGFFADKTHQYWTFTIVGYASNVLAVPLLGLAGHWWVAAFLIVLERMGKAIRVPSRDAMLSHAGEHVGMGKVFGLHEALDQIGGMSGPLIISAILYCQGTYQHAFAALLIPALLTLIVLGVARITYPKPEALAVKKIALNSQGLPHAYWLYLIAASLVAAGYADFPLIAYHFQKTAAVSPVWIPALYALSMGVAIITAPLFGFLYDKKGFFIIIVATLLSLLFAPLVFFGDMTWIVIGVLLWGIGISAQESLMRAIVASMAPKNKLGSAYGVFNMSFGMCWFLGSYLMGVLYDISVIYLVVFSVVMQMIAVPILFFVRAQA
jgi:MFS family permease